MNLTPQERNRLLNFIGYGNLDAPVWFLGMEEGTGGHTDLNGIQANIRVRATHFQPIEDLVESHQYFDYDIPSQRKFTQVWLWMAKLVRGLEGKTDWQHTAKAKEYVRQRLGRRSGETLLTELMPLPAPGINYWPYDTLWKTRNDYLEAILPQRQAMLLELVNEHQPRVVFAYGSQYHVHYKQVFAGTHWRRLPTKKRIELGTFGETSVTLMPFFGNGGLSHHDAAIVIRTLHNR
jgi:hypothetical protein